MKWISTKKKLPEPRADVLAVSVTRLGDFFSVDVLRYSDGDWWRSMDGVWPFFVTHWMPLPEPPESDELPQI